jgi:hypothetical protein
VCGRPRDVHEVARGATCSDPRCRWLHLRRTLVARRQRLEQAALALATGALATLGETAPGRFALALLPANDRRISNLPARRRRRLRDHLARLVSAAAEQSASRRHGPPPARGEPDEGAEELAVLAAGCATCRGYCCRLGGDSAFLEVATLRRYLAEHSGVRPRDALEAYLARLPEKTYRGSCVYHAARGCALPRDMRADQCNQWYCEGLRDLRSQMRETGTHSALAVASDSDRVLRTALIGPGGAREIDPGAAAGPPASGSAAVPAGRDPGLLGSQRRAEEAE